jgi:hypothetical protein
VNPLTYLVPLVAVVLIVDYEIRRERNFHSSPSGRRMDVRALVTIAAVVAATGVLGARMIELIS